MEYIEEGKVKIIERYNKKDEKKIKPLMTIKKWSLHLRLR